MFKTIINFLITLTKLFQFQYDDTYEMVILNIVLMLHNFIIINIIY